AGAALRAGRVRIQEADDQGGAQPFDRGCPGLEPDRDGLLEEAHRGGEGRAAGQLSPCRARVTCQGLSWTRITRRKHDARTRGGEGAAMKMEPAPAPPVYGIIIEKDLDVPMRDGARLKADVFRPDDGGRVPAILNLGPFQKDKL